MGKDEVWSGDTDTVTSPLNNEPKISPGDLRILDVFNDGFNMTISLPHSRVALFYIRNCSWTFGKPDVTLSAGSKKGPVLGGLKLAFFHQDTFYLGDPSLGQVAYKQLRKTSTWTHNRYEFECGKVEKRPTFVWIRTRMPFWGDQPDLELREKFQSGDRGDQLGAVLATYRGLGHQEFNSTGKRGTFSTRKNIECGTVNEKRSLPDWSDWELMVLLTACGLIEAARRRARARRAAQHGMPFSS